MGIPTAIQTVLAREKNCGSRKLNVGFNPGQWLAVLKGASKKGDASSVTPAVSAGY